MNAQSTTAVCSNPYSVWQTTEETEVQSNYFSPKLSGTMYKSAFLRSQDMLKAECSPRRWLDTKPQNSGFHQNNYTQFTAQPSVANTYFSVTFWICPIIKPGGVPLLVYSKELFHNEIVFSWTAHATSPGKNNLTRTKVNPRRVSWSRGFSSECLGRKRGLCLSNNQNHFKKHTVVLIGNLLSPLPLQF